MSDRKYYLICDDNCKFEGMTKEQIYSVIAEATGNTPTSVDGAFITMIKESNANKALSFWMGTEAEFNALGATGEKMYVKADADGKLYLLPDDDDLITEEKLSESFILPIDKGGTGATTTDEIKTLLGLDSVGVNIVLLWENGGKTSEFKAQSANVGELTNYDFIGIVVGYNGSPANGTQLNISRIRHDGTTTIACHCWYIDSSNKSTTPYRKAVIEKDSNNVDFAGGYNGSGTSNNSYAIPHAIYGIKGATTREGVAE